MMKRIRNYTVNKTDAVETATVTGVSQDPVATVVNLATEPENLYFVAEYVDTYYCAEAPTTEEAGKATTTNQTGGRSMIKRILAKVNRLADKLKGKANARKRIALNLNGGSVDVTLNGHGDSSLCRYLTKLGLGKADIIRTVSHNFDKVEKQVLVLNQDVLFDANVMTPAVTNWRRNLVLKTICANDWICNDGTHYVPFGKSASQERCAESTWIRADMAAPIENWWTMNLPLKNDLPATKYYTYLMQADSTSLPYSVVHAGHVDLIPVDFRKIGVFDDPSIAKEGFEYLVVDDVSGKVERKALKDMEKDTDGIIFHIIHTKLFNEEQMARYLKLRAEHKLLPGTIRGIPFFKGLEVFIEDVALEKWVEDHHGSFMVKDHWGHEVDIRTLDMITFCSVFKASKCKCITSWEMYADLLVKYGHELAVCKLPHVRKADLPYQQTQALWMNDDDVEFFARKNNRQFERTYSMDGAISMLSEDMRFCARLYPRLLGDVFFMDQINKAHMRKRAHAANGRILNVGCYVFLCPDISAILLELTGGEGTGLIAKRELRVSVFNKAGKELYPVGINVGYTRNPCPGMNVMLAKNIAIPEEYSGLFMENVFFCSAYGLTMPVLQADFDGDTVLAWNASEGIGKKISKCAAEAQKRAGYRCVLFKSNVPTMKGGDDYLRRSIVNSKSAAIGLYAMGVAKLLAADNDWTDDDLRRLEAGMTLCVDSAKNGGEDPKWATDVLDSIREGKMKKPMYVFYGKVSPALLETAQPDDTYTLMMESPVEKLSQKVLTNTPAHYPFEYINTEFDNGRSQTADWRILMKDLGEGENAASRTKLPELMKKSASTGDGLREFRNSLFGRLVSEARDERNGTTLETRSLVDKTNAERIKQEIYAYGAKNGCSKDVTLNTLILMIYVCESREADKNIKIELLRSLWLAFGDELKDNVWSNVCANKLPNVCVPFEESTFSDDEMLDGKTFTDDYEDRSFELHADE